MKPLDKKTKQQTISESKNSNFIEPCRCDYCINAEHPFERLLGINQTAYYDASTGKLAVEHTINNHYGKLLKKVNGNWIVFKETKMQQEPNSVVENKNSATQQTISERKGIKEDLVVFKGTGVWTIYPDNKAHALFPRWWHKLMFWKKWSYGGWKIRREYKNLSDIIDDMASKKL